ncbi:MAG TPA: hypothetical protein VFG69_08315, partial [Nannocystaceae bacterium]|nr:hypothetical protein [Nannocystaceae bacterium]
MSCRVPATAQADAHATDEGWSRIVVHAAVEPPVGVRIAAGVGLVGGWANYGGLLPEPGYERVDAFPVERRCARMSMCVVVIRNRMGAVVFAFDPVVEVELSPSHDARGLAFVRYRDPHTTSAALGKVYEHSSALEHACQATRVERARRRERAAPRERALRQVVQQDERGVVRRAAALALVQGQCTGADENRAIARRLLDELQPTAPEL